MKIKKLPLGFFSALVLLSTLSVFADSSERNIYANVQLGYAQSDWANNASNGLIGVSQIAEAAATSNGKGGFSGGADLGYGITRYFAVEAGWMHLPQVEGVGYQLGDVPGQTITINSWLSYAAFKFIAPLTTQFDLFGKVGLGYRALTNTVPVALYSTNAVGNGHYFTPVFAAGAEYNYQNWLFGGQYLYFPGNAAINNGASNGLLGLGAPNAAPEVNLYTGFIGYQFNI